MTIELIDRRVFGAVEFVNAVTGQRLTDGLAITAPELDLRRNPRGFYVIWGATGLDDYTRDFEAPPVLPSRGFEMTVDDPQRRFLRQALTVSLPRAFPLEGEPAPADADNALVPIRIAMYPAAAMSLSFGWASLRLRVELAGDARRRGLANVWVELTPRVPGAMARQTLTDGDGEALIAFPDVPPLMPDAGSVSTLSADFSADLRLVLDPQFVRLSDPGGALPAPDPALIRQRAAAAAHAGLIVVEAAEPVLLSAGSSRRHVASVSWPA